jgi:hypothetical protein
MTDYDICVSCGRHIKRTETICPFCNNGHISEKPLPAWPLPRMSRAKWMLLVSATSLASCNGKDSAVDDGGTVVALDADREDNSATADDATSTDTVLDSSVALDDVVTVEPGDDAAVEAANQDDAPAQDVDAGQDDAQVAVIDTRQDDARQDDASQDAANQTEASLVDVLDGSMSDRAADAEAGVEICLCPPGTVAVNVASDTEAGMPLVAPGTGCVAIWEHCGTKLSEYPTPDDAGSCGSGFIALPPSQIDPGPTQCLDPCGGGSRLFLSGRPACPDSHPTPSTWCGQLSCPTIGCSVVLERSVYGFVYGFYVENGVLCYSGACYGCPPHRPELVA